MNFARDLIAARSASEDLALVELRRDGARQTWSFGEIETSSARLAAALLQHGVERGDVVMTLIGNRPEWVLR